MTGADKHRRTDARFDVDRFLFDVSRFHECASRRDIAREADVNLGSLLRAFTDGALTLMVACRLADWADLNLDDYRRWAG